MLADAEEISSDSDWAEVSPQKAENATVRGKKNHPGRNSTCPVRGCQFSGRKLKFHVQSEHMPRILWDNPQPPVREDRVSQWTEWRYQALLFLARCIVQSERVEDLERWTQERLTPAVPVQCQILDNSQDQMRLLARWMYWRDPGRFELVPPNSPCVLIHWRYQVLFFQHLSPSQRLQYLDFGHQFMCDVRNLTASKYEYAQSHSLNARMLADATRE